MSPLHLVIWCAVGLSLGSSCGPAGALWTALVALLSLWTPGARSLRALTAATLAAGLGGLGWAAPPLASAALAALALWSVRARAGRFVISAALGGVVVVLVTAVAMGGGRGASPSWDTAARLVSALLLAAVGLGWPAPSRRPWLGPALGAVIVIGLVGARVALLTGVSQPTTASGDAGLDHVEAARLGARASAARAQRDRVCALLRAGERKAAVRALSRGALLAPAELFGAEAQLWRAALVAPGDPRQARAIAARTLRRFGDQDVIHASRPRERDFVLQLAAWSDESQRDALTEALVRVAATEAAGAGLTTCPDPAPPR